VKGDARGMPFDDNTFDIVFTNGPLHEWSQPVVNAALSRKCCLTYSMMDWDRLLRCLGLWRMNLSALAMQFFSPSERSIQR